ncbi:MAG: TauD/TfdA family dioxygenase [Gammaproteobacteria bacterium]|nr:TauD/TfdA family dioxygenase [Gammaproteobacteria bacterium]
MMSTPLKQKNTSTPFNLDTGDAYEKWRDKKLENYPTSLGDLVVEVIDPRILSDAEHNALLDVCRKTNMVIYAGKTGSDPDPEIPLSIGRRFGVQSLDSNWLANDMGLTSLTVAKEGIRQHYIPYTNQAINWHTDGYYNTSQNQIHSLLLHVVQRAAQGGENALMDHEIAYILLREKNPDYIRALMRPDVMTIPARIEEGKIARAEESGPVFSVSEKGNLHMRYTIRVNNVIWSEEPLIQEALSYLQEVLNNDSTYIYRGLLEPGMGLISNNVLHDRAAFTDSDEYKRHFYRARYFNRLQGTSILENQ